MPREEPSVSTVTIPTSDGAELPAYLHLPRNAHWLVVLASVTADELQSRANKTLVGALADAGGAVLLVDLMTPQEHEEDAELADLRYDIGLLTVRLGSVVEWALSRCGPLPVGLLAASTGGAAALSLAAERDGQIGAVVIRGGRPDLAGDTLRAVRTPTLLLVGGEDSPLVDLNREAATWLKGDYRMEILPRAAGLSGSHPSAAGAIARRAVDWFERYLGG